MTQEGGGSEGDFTPRQAHIRILADVKETSVSFEEILKRLPTKFDEDRLRSYTKYEQRDRALYNQRRYLIHQTIDELHDRIGYLIANPAYVSGRGRYSLNSMYISYWRAKLAHAAEELALRNDVGPVCSDRLRHLPSLSFQTPRAVELAQGEHGANLYRYDSLERLNDLRSTGRVLLRCGSTQSVGDPARDDANELCLKTHLLTKNISIEMQDSDFMEGHNPRSTSLNIYHRSDFYMFCLSRVYDWRLFGDFGSGIVSGNPSARMACLVITDPLEFTRRFAAASERFVATRQAPTPWGWEINSGPAFYYDPCDPNECPPLINNPEVRPFAKRREYTYQHEYRFVIRPHLPEEYVPPYTPHKVPHFDREILELGTLDDISHIVEATSPADQYQFPYHASKSIRAFTAAMGVTLPSARTRVRFTFSLQMKERGRADHRNLMSPKNMSGVGIHEQQLDVEDSDGNVLAVLIDFYSALDIREQGNFAPQFDVHTLPAGKHVFQYRCHLTSTQPDEKQFEIRFVEFHFRYSVRDSNGKERFDAMRFQFNASIYMAKWNGVGPPRLNIPYKTLLTAEFMFLRAAKERELNCLTSYKCHSEEMGYVISEFAVLPHYWTEFSGEARGN